MLAFLHFQDTESYAYAAGAELGGQPFEQVCKVKTQFLLGRISGARNCQLLSLDSFHCLI